MFQKKAKLFHYEVYFKFVFIDFGYAKKIQFPNTIPSTFSFYICFMEKLIHLHTSQIRPRDYMYGIFLHFRNGP